MPLPVQNLGVSLVATAPSPATSGLTLVVTAGQGSWFDDPASVGSYPVTIWAAGSIPDRSNSEIALCTAKSTDTLTLTRAYWGTARSVIVGDQIVASIIAETFTGRDALTSYALTQIGVR